MVWDRLGLTTCCFGRQALDTTVAGKHHLYKTLLKIKAAAASPSLGPEVLHLPAVEHDAPTLNVIARLCNSNPVKEALPPVLEEVQRAAGIDVEKGAGNKKRMRAKDYEKAKQEEVHNTLPAKKARDRNVDVSGSDDLYKEASISDDEFADFDDRLASSGDESGSDDDDEDMDIEELERRLAQEGIKRKSALKTKSKYDPMADLSLSDISRSPSLSPEPQKTSKMISKPAIKASSFVPSLSLGGYISGSGSDPDSDIDIAPTKKNRRGQRARQQIWEKKFGTGAKHLTNPSAKKSDRNAGWDAKRGATDGKRDYKSGAGRGPKSSGANGEAVKPKEKKKHNDSEGPLHPSWEAAKKAKEAKSVPVAFAGKKITFD